MAQGVARQRLPVTGMVWAGCSIAAFTATLDNTVVAVALRDMQRDLGCGVTGLQGIVTAYTVTLAALLLAGGALVDRVGAKQVLLAGLALFAAASAGCAASGSIGAVVAWRGAQGAGAALVLPGGLALLAASIPDEHRRRRAIAGWAAIAGLALVAGPVVGGELVEAHGWTSVFWVNLPLSAAAGFLALMAPRTSGARRSLDVPGMVLTCGALGSGTSAVVLAGHGSRSLMAVTAAVAVAMTAALVVVERRAREPLLPTSLLRDRRLRAATIGTLATALALFLALVFLGLYLQLVQDRDARDAGRVLLALPAGLVVVAAATSRWRATLLPAATGLALTGLPLLLLGHRLKSGTSSRELEAWLLLVGAGIGLCTAPLVAAALAAGQRHAGLAAATVSMARELGGVAAVGGLGSLAVGRLAGRLSDTLASGGVAPGARPALVDAALGARSDEVRRLLLQDVGIARALSLGPRLSHVASDSFVSSTGLVLQVAGSVVLVAALMCAWLLRPSGPRPGARARPPG